MIYIRILLGYNKIQREMFWYVFRIPGMDLKVPFKVSLRYVYEYARILEVLVLHRSHIPTSKPDRHLPPSDAKSHCPI